MLGIKLKNVLGLIKQRKCLVLNLYPTQPEITDARQVLETLLKWTRMRGIADPTWMEIDAKGVTGRNLKFNTALKKITELQSGTEINALWLNCALHAVDDRFEGWSWHRTQNRSSINQ